MRAQEINYEDEMTANERAWMDFLLAHSPGNGPEPSKRFIRLLIGICERRARYDEKTSNLQ